MRKHPRLGHMILAQTKCYYLRTSLTLYSFVQFCTVLYTFVHNYKVGFLLRISFPYLCLLTPPSNSAQCRENLWECVTRCTLLFLWKWCHQHNQCDIVVFVELCVKRVCESSTSLLIAESLNTLSFCTFNGWALWFIWTRPDHDEHGVPKSLHMCRPCSRPDLELSPLFVAWTQAPMVAQISQPFILTWTPPFKRPLAAAPYVVDL